MTTKPRKPYVRELVHLRERPLNNGKKALYLEQRQGGRRYYESLHLYLLPEATPADREHNRETRETAERIKAKRILQITTTRNGVTRPRRVRFLDYLDALAAKREKPSTRKNWTATRKNWAEAFGEAVMLDEVTPDTLRRFLAHLRKKYATNTRKTYFVAIESTLLHAQAAGLIQSYPVAQLEKHERPKTEETEREFLTDEEVRAFASVPTRATIAKSAFLFCCFCGLRLSDVKALTWGQIIDRGGRKYICLRMQKTEAPLLLPLSASALAQLPPRKGLRAPAATARVFPGLCERAVQKSVPLLAKKAGIHKRVTFHTSRHTFATLALSHGADLFVVSRLLGHTDIKTTQIYAHLLDKSKEEAVGLLDGIL